MECTLENIFHLLQSIGKKSEARRGQGFPQLHNKLVTELTLQSRDSETQCCPGSNLEQPSDENGEKACVCMFVTEVANTGISICKYYLQHAQRQRHYYMA